LPVDNHLDNMCRIPCSCTYSFEYSYGHVVRSQMKNVSHSEYTNICFFSSASLSVFSQRPFTVNRL